jgi:prophage regulatory protein
MKKKQALPENPPPTLPSIGKLRWSKIAPFSPYSKETFRTLSKEGRAPQAEKLGSRIALYDNSEVRRWLADPVGYTVTKED